jgi:hypothetical protein
MSDPKTTGCLCDGEPCALCMIMFWFVGGYPAPEPTLTDEQRAAVLAYVNDPGDDNTGPTYDAMRAVGLPAWGEPANVR